MSLSGHFFSGNGPMVALVLMLLQLLVVSSVLARPSGQALLGGDKQDCDAIIDDNVQTQCANEANIKFPGNSPKIHCQQDYCTYQCETLVACKSCSSNSLAMWIQNEQRMIDKQSQSNPNCQNLEKPVLICPTTPPPTTNLTTTTTTKLPTTTKAGFPMWIIAVVIVAVVVILGAIAGYFFLCRKSKTPKPNKSSPRLGSSAPAVVSSAANKDAVASGGPGNASAGPTGVGGGRDTHEAQGSRQKLKKSSRRGKGSKASRRSKRASKKSSAAQGKLGPRVTITQH